MITICMFHFFFQKRDFRDSAEPKLGRNEFTGTVLFALFFVIAVLVFVIIMLSISYQPLRFTCDDVDMFPGDEDFLIRVAGLSK